MLVSIYFAKKSEIFFPFEVDDHKFDWETFKRIHEGMKDQELLDIIS